MRLIEIKLIVYIACAVLLWEGAILSQEKDFSISTNQSDKKTEKIQKQVSIVFNDVESGIVSNNVDFVAKHFSRQIYVSLRGAESGYFSMNQATYLVENYFTVRKIINFKFTTTKLSGEVPYATGGGYFTLKGKQELFQVYISLSKNDSRLVITQFNVY